MKITKLLLGLTAGVLAASCSTDDTASNGYTAQEDGMRYLKVALCNPTSTRASLSSPDGYENGSDDENRIEGLRFVFYDTKGNRVSNVVDFNKSDLQDMQTGSGTGSGGTVEKFITATLPIQIIKGEELPAYVMCFVNPVRDNQTMNDNISLINWRNMTYNDYMGANNCFAMSNSAYYDYDPMAGGQFTKISGTPIQLGDLYQSADDAKDAEEVEIFVERYAAKVRFEMKADAVQDNTEVDGCTLTFMPKAWAINADAPSMYVVKRFASTAGDDAPIPAFDDVLGAGVNWWNDAANHRSYWACSPSYFASDYPQVSDNIRDYVIENNIEGVGNGAGWVPANDADYPYSLKYYSYDQIVANGQNPNAGATEMYTLENTVHENGLHSINPRAAAPSVILVGNYRIRLDGETTPIDQNTTFYLYGRQNDKHKIYIDGRDDILDAMLANQTVLAKDAAGTLLGKDDKDAYKADFAIEHPSLAVRNRANQTVPARFVTLQLARANTALHFFKDGQWVAVSSTNIDEVNTALMQSVGFARSYVNGMCYFSIPIKHVGFYQGDNPNADKNAGDESFDWASTRTGDYGLVRNHIYDIAVNSISGLATGLHGSDNPIVPPMNEETYHLRYKLNILQWGVVRKQEVDL